MGEPTPLIIERRWLIRLNRGLRGLRRLRGFFIGFRRCLLSEPGFMGLQADFHCCYPSIRSKPSSVGGNSDSRLFCRRELRFPTLR